MEPTTRGRPFRMIVPTRFPTRPLAALVALISVGLLGASASASAATRAPHAPHPPHAAGTSQASHPSLRQLTGTLGVLRRPQTQTDRAPQLITELDQQSHSTIDLGLFGRPVASLARLATTAPWGQKIYLVPMLPPTQAAISKLPSNVKGAARNSTAGIEFYSSPLGGAPRIPQRLTSRPERSSTRPATVVTSCCCPTGSSASRCGRQASHSHSRSRRP